MTVAGDDTEGSDDPSVAAGPDATPYGRTPTNLAEVLALATRGTGDLELQKSWTEDFAAYSTYPGVMAGNGPDDDKARVDQDLANRQNLLLLLSRGHWSTAFLQKTTRAFWEWEHKARESGNAPWPGRILEDAKYAPAPNGAYPTDGMVALMAALTLNPGAAGWAFAGFQAGTVDVEYDDAKHPMGTFAHDLFLKHAYATSGSGAADLGMTASITALMSAIDATGGSYGDGAAGPMGDLFVLQAYLDDQADQPWYKQLDDLIGSALHSAGGLAHLALDAVGFVPVVGDIADGASGIWSAVEGDWPMAGLSFAAMVPLAGVAAGAAKAAKDGKSFTRLGRSDKDVIARGGRNEKGQFVAGKQARAEAAAKEAQGVKDYEATSGLTVVRKADGSAVQVQASARGVQHPRLYDGLAKKPDGTYEAIEVKGGGAKRTGNQTAFDEQVSYANPATATLPDGTPITITSVAPPRPYPARTASMFISKFSGRTVMELHRQYALGRPAVTPDGPTVEIAWPQSSTAVPANEVFDADEAAKIFFHYFQHRKVPGTYSLRELDRG